jgi:hypothetical protein
MKTCSKTGSIKKRLKFWGRRFLEGKTDYLTATELRERSWTEQIIKKLNLTPCDIIPNPECSSATIKIYDRTLVEISEATEEFKALVKADKSKKKGALKENKKRKEKLSSGHPEGQIDDFSKK